DQAAIHCNLDLDCAGGNIHGEALAAGPTHPHLQRTFSGSSQDLHWTILGPISSAALHFPHRTELVTLLEPELRAIAEGVAGGSLQSNPQPWFGTNVPEKASFCRVLSHY